MGAGDCELVASQSERSVVVATLDWTQYRRHGEALPPPLSTPDARHGGRPPVLLEMEQSSDKHLLCV